MPRPIDPRTSRALAEGDSNSQCPGTCRRCATAVQASEKESCLTPLHLEGFLQDLEQRHIESLSQIRRLAKVIRSPEGGDMKVAQQRSCAAGDVDHIDEFQSEPRVLAVARVGSRTDFRKSRTKSADLPVNATRSDTVKPTISLGNRKIGSYLEASETDARENTQGRFSWLSFQARRFLGWKGFDYMIGMIILLNTILLGMQAQFELEGHQTWVMGSEHVFLAIYCLELLLRIIGYGCACLRNGWVAFDAILVCLGVTSEWILQPIVSSASRDAEFIKQIMVLRVLRLLRLLRALRMMHVFRTAWRLAHGLLTSGNTIASVLGLLVLALYIFTLAGIEIITKDSSLTSNPAVSSIIQQNFNSVPRFLLTLSQFVLADSVASLYSPLIEAKPILALYFVPVMLIVSVSLMNLVTAVIVEGALATASRDKELEARDMKERARRLAPKFEDLFHSIDTDGSGLISIDEVNTLTAKDLPREAVDHVDPDSMLELSQVLDVDGSGDVSQDEFVHGMIGLCMAEVPKEMLLTLKLTRVQMRATLEMQARLGEVEDKICRALGDLAKTQTRSQ